MPPIQQPNYFTRLLSQHTPRFPNATSPQVTKGMGHELWRVRDQFLKVAAPDTAFSDQVYHDRKGVCDLTGHCAAVAHVLQQKFGGDLVRGIVELELDGTLTEEVHYWNRIHNLEYDLTGSQYGGDGIHPLNDPFSWSQVVYTNGLLLRRARIKSFEYRDRVTHSDRFDLLASRMP